MIQKKNPLRPGKNYISARSARYTASRDCEQRKHWASASPRLRAMQKKLDWWFTVTVKRCRKRSGCWSDSFILFFLFFVVVVDFAKPARPRPTEAWRGCATAFYSLAQSCKKRQEEKENPERQKFQVTPNT